MQWTRRLVLLAPCLSHLPAQAPRANFSGRWTMNQSESQLGSKMREGGYRERLVIQHTEPTLRIGYSLWFQGHETQTDYLLRTDGTETRARTPLGEEVSITRWEGVRLVTDSRLEGSQREDRTTRYVSDDGRKLFVAYGKSPNPKWLVFDRD